MKIPWFCAIREHRHSTEWEADACTELYELWQMATAQLLADVREDGAEAAVNEALYAVLAEYEADEEKNT